MLAQGERDHAARFRALHAFLDGIIDRQVKRAIGKVRQFDHDCVE